MAVLLTEPKMAIRVLTGRKTAHTVPRKALKTTCVPPPPKTKPPWHPNEVVPVQTTGMVESPLTGQKELRRLPICHVRVTAVWPCQLEEFTDEAATAEGFPDAGALFAWWRESRQKVEPPASTERPVYEIPVWTAALQVVEVDHFLAPGNVDPRHPPADEHGYVLSPVTAVDDAAAIDPVRLNFYAEENRNGDTDRERERREQWERRSLADRAAELERLASFSRADVSKELRLASHAMGKAFEKLSRMDRAA